MMNPSMQQTIQQTLNNPQAQQQTNQVNVNMNNLHQMSATQRAELIAQQRARGLGQFPPNMAMNQTPQGPAPPYRNPNINAANNMNAGNPSMNMAGMGPGGKPMLSQAAQFQQQQQQQRLRQQQLLLQQQQQAQQQQQQQQGMNEFFGF